jgi:hypothetical protein
MPTFGTDAAYSSRSGRTTASRGGVAAKSSSPTAVWASDIPSGSRSSASAFSSAACRAASVGLSKPSV